MRGLLGLLLLLGIGLPDPAAAQWRPQADSEWPEAEGLPVALPQQIESRGARAMGLSLLVPGLGQHDLDRSRKWIFGAIEVMAWVAFAERRSSGAEMKWPQK